VGRALAIKHSLTNTCLAKAEVATEALNERPNSEGFSAEELSTDSNRD
jgi:hypothetical protein